MPDHSAHLERMKVTLRREAEIIDEVARSLDEGAVAAVDLLIVTRGHVLVGGAGTSNAVARRFAHLLSCCGIPAVFIHPADSLHGGAGAVKPDDTVVLISKGGTTAEVNRFGEIARSRGAKIIAFTEDPASELGQMADVRVVVKIPDDSDPFGMVATSSSLANAAVADAICEAVLAATGYTVQRFAATHPSGAVGKKIEDRRILRGWPSDAEESQGL
jgi:arabinose-5-phosphate isomerase